MPPLSDSAYFERLLLYIHHPFVHGYRNNFRAGVDSHFNRTGIQRHDNLTFNDIPDSFRIYQQTATLFQKANTGLFSYIAFIFVPRIATYNTIQIQKKSFHSSVQFSRISPKQIGMGFYDFKRSFRIFPPDMHTCVKIGFPVSVCPSFIMHSSSPDNILFMQTKDVAFSAI